MEYYLGLDLGTGSIKSVLFDAIRKKARFRSQRKNIRTSSASVFSSSLIYHFFAAYGAV